VLPGLDLGLSAYNLLDKVYYDPGGPEHVQDKLPQSRRSLEFKVTYRF
jgi:outer membrane receptor protein involved in Fe transport